MPRITLVKEKKAIECAEGANLREVLLANGVEVYPGIAKRLNCGGKGTCGTCRVHVKAGMERTSQRGLLESIRTAISFFAIDHEDEVRLSCQTRVLGDVTVETQPEANLYGRDVWKYTTREAGLGD